MADLYKDEASMGVVSFRPLDRSDFPLLQRWLAEPHVDAWWHQPLDLSGLEQKYGPRLDAVNPIHVFIIEHEHRPIGWIQWYRWSDFPEHAAQLNAEPGAAGIDLAIGEIASIGKGLGSRAIREFVFGVVFSKPQVTAIVADPEEQNRRSCRAFEKAGFVSIGTVQVRKETVWRRVMHLSAPDSIEKSSDMV